jgi:hypothetical protein
MVRKNRVFIISIIRAVFLFQSSGQTSPSEFTPESSETIKGGVACLLVFRALLLLKAEQFQEVHL